LISLFFTGVKLKFIKALRMLRVLRPLRMISRNEGLKIAVQSLINAIPGIVNVLVISLLFFLLFGIFGVNYFKGGFYRCFEYQEGILETAQDCVNIGGEWMNIDANFDNIMNAMVTLFEMATTEGWIAVMWNGVDSRGLGYQPKRENSMIWVLFFILFIIVGSLFILNLFVGVVINTFNEEKEKLGKNHLLTAQ
jgi:hypothetical protein